MSGLRGDLIPQLALCPPETVSIHARRYSRQVPQRDSTALVALLSLNVDSMFLYETSVMRQIDRTRALRAIRESSSVAQQ